MTDSFPPLTSTHTKHKEEEGRFQKPNRQEDRAFKKKNNIETKSASSTAIRLIGRRGKKKSRRGE